MPLAWGGGIFGGGGGEGVSGSGASGRLALWSGAGTLTSDSGLTYSGTGATFFLAGKYFTGIEFRDASQTIGLSANTLGLNANGKITWSSSTGAYILPTTDTSLSRISAGVIGVGTGAAGSVDGTVQADGYKFATGSGWLHGAAGRIQFLENSQEVAAAGSSTTLGLGINASYPLSWGVLGGTMDLFLTYRAAATLQLGAADSGTPVAQTLAFQGSRGGTDTNVAGAAATIQGSLGTGTGGGGDIAIRTAPRGSTGTAQNTPSDRLVLAAKQVTLTESSATPILDVAVASGTVAGGTVWYTIRADDATDFQSFRGQVQWAAVNKGGVLTASIAAVGADAVATSSGTLTSTATITTGTNSITINLNAVSSLTQTTLYAFVSAQLDGTGVVTTK